MLNTPINSLENLSQFQDQWSPNGIAELNDYQFKLLRIQDEFVWHEHAESGEALVVLIGRLKIDLPESTVELAAGELFVVPRGIRHKPSADEQCNMLVIEPRGVVNTGDVGGESFRFRSKCRRPSGIRCHIARSLCLSISTSFDAIEMVDVVF